MKLFIFLKFYKFLFLYNVVCFTIPNVTNSYLVLWEFNTSQKELPLVSSRNISSLISGGDSADSWVLVCALGLL